MNPNLFTKFTPELLGSPFFWINLAVWVCSIALIIAVFMDFMLYEEKKNTSWQMKSKVATGNMFGFFWLLYFTLVIHVGILSLPYDVKLIVSIIGLIIVIISTILNIVGRFYLKNNWANHIKIYDDHTLVTYWAYKIVRHPLYASLIRFWYGVGLVYSNWLIIIFTSCIFVPMMIYRAKQEEMMLSARFNNYSEYKQKVGMFLPKLF